MLGHYIVMNDRDKRLMVLRPYQVFAVEPSWTRCASTRPPPVMRA